MGAYEQDFQHRIRFVQEVTAEYVGTRKHKEVGTAKRCLPPLFMQKEETSIRFRTKVSD